MCVGFVEVHVNCDDCVQNPFFNTTKKEWADASITLK